MNVTDLPKTETTTEHVAYYPQYAIRKGMGAKSYPTREALLADWQHSPVVIETRTITRHFEYVTPGQL